MSPGAGSATESRSRTQRGSLGLVDVAVNEGGICAAGRLGAMDDEVRSWFDQTANPMAPTMRAVRDVIMDNPDVSECIKYRAPAFEHGGLMCYFNWSAKRRVSLIFPSGRRIPGEHPHLESGSNVQRIMYFDDLDDVARKAAALNEAIAAYQTTR